MVPHGQPGLKIVTQGPEPRPSKPQRLTSRSCTISTDNYEEDVSGLQRRHTRKMIRSSTMKEVEEDGEPKSNTAGNGCGESPDGQKDLWAELEGPKRMWFRP